MPKLFRTLVPLAVMAVLAVTPSSLAAPGPTSPWNGGFFGNAPHSANYEWVSSTHALPNSDASTPGGRYISDAAFVGNIYAIGSYDNFGLYDISDPYNPVEKSLVRCPGSQGDLIVHGNLLMRAHEGSHNIPFGDLNRACETAGANMVERITLLGFDTDGESYTLRFGGSDSHAIVRGQNNTTAGVVNAIQGGNEQQQVNLTGATTGSSYQLQMGGNTSTVTLTIGTNHTAATIQQILLGVDEVQTVGLAGFDPNAGDQFHVTIGGQNSALIPAAPGNLTAGEIQTAINAIPGFAGTVAVSGVTNTGFTITFGGASAKTNVANVGVTIDTCAGSCTPSVAETTQGRAPLHPSLLGGSVTVGTVANTGYTLTFTGPASTDILPLSVVNPSAGVTGSVRELAKGGTGIAGWPAGGTVTVANQTGGSTPAGSHNDWGYLVTFTGTLAGTNPALLQVTNLNGLTRTIIERQTTAAPGVGFQGLTIFDISDPTSPKFLKAVPSCGGAHTFTKYFDKKKNQLVIYMTRGTTGTAQPQYGLSCAGLITPRLTAIVIPVKNPKAAHVASENVPTGFGSGGCHDVNVHQEAKLLAQACSGGGGASLSDISDPLNSQLRWTFTWPGLATTHSAAISWDAKYIYVNGEPGGGGAPECAFDDDLNKPTVHILEAATGKLLGHWAIPRAQPNVSGIDYCTVHVVQMVPFVGRQIMATSFYNGGMSLVDFTNPKAAREVGFMQNPTTTAAGAVVGEGMWTGYVYNNNQYGSELTWGFHIWKLNEPWWENQLQVNELNGQTNDAYIRCKITQSGGPARAMQLANATATVQLSIERVAPLQTGKGVKVRFEAPGFSKEAITDSSGQVTVPVIGNKAGKLRVTAPVQPNLPFGCAAKAKSIKKALR
jgi:hypothetical protein